MLSTYQAYRSHYPEGLYDTLPDFFRAMFAGRGVKTVVDVWCEAPILEGPLKDMLEIDWEKDVGVEYRFVIGVHP